MFNLTTLHGLVTNIKKEDIFNKYPYLGEPKIGTKYRFTIEGKKVIFMTNECFDIDEGKELSLWGYKSQNDPLCRIKKEESDLQVLFAKNNNKSIRTSKFANTKVLSFLLAAIAIILLFQFYISVSNANNASPVLAIFYIFLFAYRPIMLIKSKFQFRK